MIIHGMRDRVVLFKDSVSLAERLMMMGKEVDLVALPKAASDRPKRPKRPKKPKKPKGGDDDPFNLQAD